MSRAGRKDCFRPLRSGADRKALEMIQANPSAVRSCRTLRPKVCLSPSRFNAVFRQAVGTAPKVYMRNQRLRRACSMLVSGNLPVYAVAERMRVQFLPLFLPFVRQARWDDSDGISAACARSGGSFRRTPPWILGTRRRAVPEGAEFCRLFENVNAPVSIHHVYDISLFCILG